MTLVRTRLSAAAVTTLIATAMAAAPSTAHAAELLDQQQVLLGDRYGLETGVTFAQTFTAGLSGSLNRVNVSLDAEQGSMSGVSVQLRNVVNGFPGGTVLASTLVPAADLAVATGSFVPFEPVAFATSPSVVAGTTYALVFQVSGEGGGYRLGSAGGDTAYDAGTGFAWEGELPPVGDPWYPLEDDFAFQTFVNQAEQPALESKCDFSGSTAGFNVIKGDAGDNVLRGTAGPDLIYGYGGDDTISGLGGDDLLCGGSGKDVIKGGHGDDRIYGGPGADRLFGNRGDDALRGGGGRDFMRGGLGNDAVNGGPAEDNARD